MERRNRAASVPRPVSSLGAPERGSKGFRFGTDLSSGGYHATTEMDWGATKPVSTPFGTGNLEFCVKPQHRYATLSEAGRCKALLPITFTLTTEGASYFARRV